MASDIGKNVITAAMPNRLFTVATAPNSTSPATAPNTPAASHQPAAEARTDVGNSSFSNAPSAGASTPPANTPQTYPTIKAAAEPEQASDATTATETRGSPPRGRRA